MFHLLTNNSIPTYLTAESKVVCGVAIRREAISQEDYRKLKNAGSLRKERICKGCYRQTEGVRYEVKD